MKILSFDIEDWFHIIQKYPDNILDKWNNYEIRIHHGMDKIFEIPYPDVTFFRLI